MKKKKFSEKNLKISAALPSEARRSRFWRRVLQLLSKPARSKAGVNVSRLSAAAPEGGVVVVPDKVLGSGQLSRKLTVAAASFSATAKTLIESAGGKAMSIPEAARKNPLGAGMAIIK